MVIVVMGPAGSGKTTVGSALAHAFACPFLDADSLHSAANVEKMRRGEGLNEADRAPWLQRVRMEIDRFISDGKAAVVACSALSERHREVLGGARPELRLVYLRASPEVLAERVARRTGHYAGPALLKSQLEVLEEPKDALSVDATLPLEDLVREIRKGLRL
jgi:gluconokinase